MLKRLFLTPQLGSHVERYAQVHQTPVNQVLHYVGIPLLLMASLGLFAKIPLWPGGAEGVLRPNAAWVVLLGAGLWYVRMDERVGLITFVMVCACYVVGSGLPIWILGLFFLTGVGAHAIGHYAFEGKLPALFARPVAVLEAPAWFVSQAGRLAQVKRPRPL